MPKKPSVAIVIEAKDLAARGVNSAITQLDRLRLSGRRLKDMLFSVQGVLGAVGLGFGAATVTRFFTNTNRQAQSLVAQLEVLEQSRDGALAVFAQIEDFAERTPFQIEELTDAYIRLRTAGIHPTEQMMTRFGDIASARSKTIQDFAMAVEDAVTGEMERLKEFGIKARQSGDQVTFIFNEQATTVRNTQSAIVDYLEEVGRSQVMQGSMAGQMDTLNGKISNMLDGFGELARMIGAEGGVNEEIGEGIEYIDGLTQAALENSAAVSSWVRLIVSLTKGAVQTIAFPVRIAWNFITSTMDLAGAAFSAFGWGVSKLSNLILTAAANMADAFGRDGEADVLREWAARQEAGAIRFEDFNKKMFEGIEKDGRDSLDALLDLGNSYRDIADAVNEVADAEAELQRRRKSWGAGGGGGGGGGTPLSDQDQKRLDKLGGVHPFDMRERLARGWMYQQGGNSIREDDGVDRTRSRGKESTRMSIAGEIWDAVDSAQQLDRVVADLTTGTISRFGDAISDAFAAFISGSEDAGDAFKQAMLGSLAAVARGLGDFYAAKATAAIAKGIGGAPQGFAEAGKWIAAATAMYAVSGAMSGFATGGGGGSSARSAAEETSRFGESSQPATVVLKGGFAALLADPDAQDSLADVLRQLTGRRVIVQEG